MFARRPKRYLFACSSQLSSAAHLTSSLGLKVSQSRVQQSAEQTVSSQEGSSTVGVPLRQAPISRTSSLHPLHPRPNRQIQSICRCPRKLSCQRLCASDLLRGAVLSASYAIWSEQIRRHIEIKNPETPKPGVASLEDIKRSPKALQPYKNRAKTLYSGPRTSELPRSGFDSKKLGYRVQLSEDESSKERDPPQKGFGAHCRVWSLELGFGVGSLEFA